MEVKSASVSSHDCAFSKTMTTTHGSFVLLTRLYIDLSDNRKRESVLQKVLLFFCARKMQLLILHPDEIVSEFVGQALLYIIPLFFFKKKNKI